MSKSGAKLAPKNRLLHTCLRWLYGQDRIPFLNVACVIHTLCIVYEINFSLISQLFCVLFKYKIVMTLLENPLLSEKVLQRSLLHIKLGLINQFVKALNKDGE